MENNCTIVPPEGMRTVINGNVITFEEIKKEVKETILPKHVTFEQAQLLKEKGFDEICFSWYSDRGDRILYGVREEDFKAPEHWQVVEWLRVKHGIHIWVEPYNDEELSLVLYENKIIDTKDDWNDSSDYTFYHSSQEAYSAAFDYVLNDLI